jgi:hypothetical protein
MRTLLIALGIVLLGNVAVADAVEVMNVKAVPAWYGRVVSPAGHTAPTVVFNSKPIAVSMQEIDRMLHAYGVEHVVDASKAPRGLITAVRTKGADGKEMTTYVFSKKPQTLSAVAVNDIFAAYGLRVVDGKKLPPAFGKEVVSKDSHGMQTKSYTFSRSAIGRSPVRWNEILAAYGK